MKSGTSSLNPYAASYVPLSKREVKQENKLNVLSGPNEGGTKQIQQQSEASLNYNSHGTEEFPISDCFSLKGHLSKGPYGSLTQTQNELTEKHILDEEFDLDLAYLQMTFPGVSDESLIDVYMVNKGDMAATVDMLNQLEFFEDDYSENLPDTLDIGDISESGTSAECASSKSKKVAGESSSSSAPRTQALSPD